MKIEIDDKKIVAAIGREIADAVLRTEEVRAEYRKMELECLRRVQDEETKFVLLAQVAMGYIPEGHKQAFRDEYRRAKQGVRK